MAIAFDASSQGAVASGTTTLSYSHTCTGQNGLLVVFIDYQATDVSISGVTYNGVAMTAIYGDTTYVAARKIALFYLLTPATGANNIVVTMSGTTTAKLGACSASYTLVLQSGQPDNKADDLTSSSISTDTVSLTTTADNCWLVGGILSGGTLTGGTGTTIRSSQPAPLDDIIRIFDSNGAITPAGSASLSVNISPANTTHGMMIASFAPRLFSVSLSETQATAETSAVIIGSNLSDTQSTSDVISKLNVEYGQKTTGTWINSPKP